MALPQVQIPSVTMSNGITIPALGYGTWMGLNSKFEFISEDVPKMCEALSYAIDIGYRHIDTAHLYRVEPEIGQIISQKFKDGICKREELFITTKVWQHFHRPEDVEVSVRASLKRLGLDYVDQVLMHWPMAIDQEGVDEKIDYLDTWRGFENVLQKGLAKTIGVSNFNIDQMKRLIENCKVKPHALQVELNLTLGQKDLVDYCQSQKVAVVAYSPFGSMVPSRSTAGSPPPKLDHPQLVAIATKHGKTPTQVALRYLYQRGIIVIPKTVTKSRVLENASIFDFELDKSDCQLMASFDVGYRTVRPTFWQNYSNYPFDKVENARTGIPLALRQWKNGLQENID